MNDIFARLRSDTLRSAFATCAIGMLLAGCSTLPSSGPTGSDVVKAARVDTSNLPFTLVEIETPAALPAPPAIAPVSLSESLPQPTDLLGAGDVLDITVYEAGVALFGGSSLRSAANGSLTFDPTSNALLANWHFV